MFIISGTIKSCFVRWKKVHTGYNLGCKMKRDKYFHYKSELLISARLSLRSLAIILGY